jgi:hypothetical protein
MLNSDFVRSMQKWRVDLWHPTTIEATALFSWVAAAVVVVVPVVIIIVIAFVAVDRMGIAAVAAIGLPDWE